VREQERERERERETLKVAAATKTHRKQSAAAQELAATSSSSFLFVLNSLLSFSSFHIFYVPFFLSLFFYSTVSMCLSFYLPFSFAFSFTFTLSVSYLHFFSPLPSLSLYLSFFSFYSCFSKYFFSLLQFILLTIFPLLPFLLPLSLFYPSIILFLVFSPLYLSISFFLSNPFHSFYELFLFPSECSSPPFYNCHRLKNIFFLSLHLFKLRFSIE